MSMSHQICQAACLGLLALGGCQTTANRPNGPATAEMAIHDFGRFGYGTQPVRTSDESTRTGLRQVSFADEGQCTDPCIDRQGTRLAFASNRHGATHDLYVRPIDGSASTRITNDAAEDVMPAFSPDGTTLAFASDRSGNYDIWMINIEGGAPVRLTTDDAHEYHPAYSPDGRRLAYCRTNPRTQRNEIWYIELRHPNHRVFVDYGTMPEWSPDPAESVLAFQRARERGTHSYALWTIRIDDETHGRPTEIISASNAAAINPTWSPDARRIAFATVTNDDAGEQTMDLWTIPREGTDLRHLTTDPGEEYQPSWSADGRIYFVSSRSGHSNIWSVADGATTGTRGTTNRMAGVADGAP